MSIYHTSWYWLVSCIHGLKSKKKQTAAQKMCILTTDIKHLEPNKRELLTVSWHCYRDESPCSLRCSQVNPISTTFCFLKVSLWKNDWSQKKRGKHFSQTGVFLYQYQRKVFTQPTFCLFLPWCYRFGWNLKWKVLWHLQDKTNCIQWQSCLRQFTVQIFPFFVCIWIVRQLGKRLNNKHFLI